MKLALSKRPVPFPLTPLADSPNAIWFFGMQVDSKAGAKLVPRSDALNTPIGALATQMPLG